MSKVGQIFVIILVAVVLICGALIFLLMGTHADDKFYVCLEINPRIEFLTNRKGIVTSYKPLNEDAKVLSVDEEFVGKGINDVTSRWIELCERANYLDVDSKNNAIKVTVLSGLTQRFENDVIRNISKKIVKDNVYCVITENQNDLQNFKQAKKQGQSPEKYDLMLAVNEDNKFDLKELENKDNRELLDMLQEQHKTFKMENAEYYREQKQLLISQNEEKYLKHMSCINDNTTRKFRTNYDKYLKQNTHKFDVDFKKEYHLWQTQRG